VNFAQPEGEDDRYFEAEMDKGVRHWVQKLPDVPHRREAVGGNGALGSTESTTTGWRHGNVIKACPGWICRIVKSTSDGKELTGEMKMETLVIKFVLTRNRLKFLVARPLSKFWAATMTFRHRGKNSGAGIAGGTFGARLAFCLKSSSSFEGRRIVTISSINMIQTYLQALDIDGEHRKEECMGQKPMGNQDYNRKSTELADGTCTDDGDHPKYGIV
jgi:hypothetical protein